MKFWRCTSAVLLMVACLPLALMAQRDGAAPGDNAQTPANELTLAGLRPGRDPVSAALKHYKQKYLIDQKNMENKEWRDACTGHSLALVVDSHSVIQQVTVSLLVPRDGNCDNRRFEFLNLDDWITGKGLKLGDSRNRVVELYGEPKASGPVVRGGADFELLRFDFAWAGSQAPQAMQVYCERESGRVMEITLSAASQGEANQATKE